VVIILSHALNGDQINIHRYRNYCPLIADADMMKDLCDYPSSIWLLAGKSFKKVCQNDGLFYCRDADMTVVIILSHGVDGDRIVCSDGRMVDMEEEIIK